MCTVLWIVSHSIDGKVFGFGEITTYVQAMVLACWDRISFVLLSIYNVSVHTAHCTCRANTNTTHRNNSFKATLHRLLCAIVSPRSRYAYGKSWCYAIEFMTFPHYISFIWLPVCRYSLFTYVILIAPHVCSDEQKKKEEKWQIKYFRRRKIKTKTQISMKEIIRWSEAIAWGNYGTPQYSGRVRWDMN